MSNHQVLDLDETLLHTYRDVNAGHSEPDYIIYASENTNQIITAGTLRPGVKKFLKWASEIFEVVVWTAGDDDYAATVMDILDADRQYIS
jgi:CTD small phosphatase-like protein 2